MKRILFFSDIHSGSNVSVMKPRYEYTTVKMMPGSQEDIETTREYIATDFQKILYDHWCDMVDHVNQLGIDYAVFLGDGVEGTNYRGKGEGVWVSDVDVQIDHAVELISMIRPKEGYIVIDGSAYHVENNMSSDHAIARRLGGAFFTDAILQIEDKQLHVKHKIGISGSIYHATAPWKDIALIAMNDEHYGKVDMIVRGHRHHYFYAEDDSRSALVCPGWKLRDKYVRGNSCAYIPSIGYVIVEIDEGYITVDKYLLKLSDKQIFTKVKL